MTSLAYSPRCVGRAAMSRSVLFRHQTVTGRRYRGPSHGDRRSPATETTMFKTIAVALCATVTLGLGLQAQAADISGAGATFPAPVYAKWAELYKASTGIGLNYQAIGSGGGIKQIQSKTV